MLIKWWNICALNVFQQLRSTARSAHRAWRGLGDLCHVFCTFNPSSTYASSPSVNIPRSPSTLKKKKTNTNFWALPLPGFTTVPHHHTFLNILTPTHWWVPLYLASLQAALWKLLLFPAATPHALVQPLPSFRSSAVTSPLVLRTPLPSSSSAFFVFPSSCPMSLQDPGGIVYVIILHPLEYHVPDQFVHIGWFDITWVLYLHLLPEGNQVHLSHSKLPCVSTEWSRTSQLLFSGTLESTAYTYTMEYYSAMKQKEIMPFAAT